VRTLAITGPTGQMLARLATAWRQVASARERDGQITAATAAGAAAHASHRAVGTATSALTRFPQRRAERDYDR